MPDMSEAPFWTAKRLDEMTPAEWESLCDGCGKCCLEKLQDADSGEISHTNVACRLLDIRRCRCTRYAREAPLRAQLRAARSQQYPPVHLAAVELRLSPAGGRTRAAVVAPPGFRRSRTGAPRWRFRARAGRFRTPRRTPGTPYRYLASLKPLRYRRPNLLPPSTADQPCTLLSLIVPPVSSRQC